MFLYSISYIVCDQAQTEYENDKQKLKNLENDRIMLQNRQTTCKNQCRDANDAYNASKKEKESLRRECECLKKTNDEKYNKCREFGVKLYQLGSELQKLELKHDLSENDIEKKSVKKQIRDLIDKINSLEKESSLADAENKTAQANLFSKVNEHHTAVNNEYKSIHHLRTKVKEYNENKASLLRVNNEINLLKQKLKL